MGKGLFGWSGINIPSCLLTQAPAGSGESHTWFLLLSMSCTLLPAHGRRMAQASWRSAGSTPSTCNRCSEYQAGAVRRSTSQVWTQSTIGRRRPRSKPWYGRRHLSLKVFSLMQRVLRFAETSLFSQARSSDPSTAVIEVEVLTPGPYCTTVWPMLVGELANDT